MTGCGDVKIVCADAKIRCAHLEMRRCKDNEDGMFRCADEKIMIEGSLGAKTSDNMDRWKSTARKTRSAMEKVRRETIRDGEDQGGGQ